MKRILASVAFAVLSTSLAFAAADPMEGRYGNTVVVTYADGSQIKLHYNKDGTLGVVNPDGSKGTGKWVLKDGKLCVTADAGPNAGKEQCSPFTGGKKAGDSWEQAMADGSKIKVEIVAGQ